MIIKFWLQRNGSRVVYKAVILELELLIQVVLIQKSKALPSELRVECHCHYHEEANIL